MSIHSIVFICLHQCALFVEIQIFIHWSLNKLFLCSVPSNALKEGGKFSNYSSFIVVAMYDVKIKFVYRI